MRKSTKELSDKKSTFDLIVTSQTIAQHSTYIFMFTFAKIFYNIGYKEKIIIIIAITTSTSITITTKNLRLCYAVLK